MGQALYRKYRSRSLNEVIGQPHITTMLKNSLQAGAIRHAYLLSGPRGVGKTSVARIIAHEVNGVSYDDEINHLDIIEIDAASNRRIDEIRELRERVRTAPSSLAYKVYIIDEVHMLTREAFNALLKTLEEPPAHAIFILATTEAHKLPDTIVSRCLRLNFKPIEPKIMKKHLQALSKKEKIDITSEALDLIAAHASGSFRDGISLMDQAHRLGDTVELTDVTTILGIAPDEAIRSLMKSVVQGQPSEVLNTLKQLKEQGCSAGALAKQLGGELRMQLLQGSPTLGGQLTTLFLRKLLSVQSAQEPFLMLEIVLLEIAITNNPSETHSNQVIEKKADTKAKAQAVAKVELPKDQADVVSDDEQAEETSNLQQPVKASGEVHTLEGVWPQFLATIKENHSTLYSLLRMASPVIEGDELTLWLDFAFHQKRLNEAKNKHTISEVLNHLTGKDFSVICALRGGLTDRTASSKSIQGDDLATISNIFGSAEMLES